MPLDARSAAERLRRAAEILRTAQQELARGPWRWADPDVGGDTIPRHPSGLTRPLGHTQPDPAEVAGPDAEALLPELRDPMDVLEDVVREARPPAAKGPRRTGLVSASIAEPLAAVLDSMAREVLDRDAGDRTWDDDLYRCVLALVAVIVDGSDIG